MIHSLIFQTLGHIEKSQSLVGAPIKFEEEKKTFFQPTK